MSRDAADVATAARSVEPAAFCCVDRALVAMLAPSGALTGAPFWRCDVLRIDAPGTPGSEDMPIMVVGCFLRFAAIMGVFG